jgi:hypothetical protein
MKTNRYVQPVRDPFENSHARDAKTPHYEDLSAAFLDIANRNRSYNANDQ